MPTGLKRAYVCSVMPRGGGLVGPPRKPYPPYRGFSVCPRLQTYTLNGINSEVSVSKMADRPWQTAPTTTK